MALGFFGNKAVKYFEMVEAAVKKGSDVSGKPSGSIPSGVGGGYTLGKDSSENIVAEDTRYNNTINKINQADSDMEERLQNIITQTEKMCDEIFIVPETTEKVRALLCEVKEMMGGFHELALQTTRIAEMYVSQINGVDGASKKVFNNSSISEHQSNSEKEINNQITALKEKLAKLKAELIKAKAELASAQSALAAAKSALSSLSGSKDERARRSALQARISSLNSRIAALNARIKELEDEIEKVEECIDEMNDAITETSEYIKDLKENVQKIDSSYADSMQASNEAIEDYINQMNGIMGRIGEAAGSVSGGDLNIIENNPGDGTVIDNPPEPSDLEKLLKEEIEKILKSLLKESDMVSLTAEIIEKDGFTILRYYLSTGGKTIDKIIEIKVETGTVQGFYDKYVETPGNEWAKILSDLTTTLGELFNPKGQILSNVLGLGADSYLNDGYYISDQIRGKDKNEITSIIIGASVSTVLSKDGKITKIIDTKNVSLY